jgi:ubiquinone/menaquinone biosynthesis C-methylase UbiE
MREVRGEARPPGEAWDEIFRTGGFPLQDPHQALVALCDQFRERKVQRILDLCCGTGRNLIFLAKEGFEVCGIDLSLEGLRQTRRKVEAAGLGAELKRGDMTEIPYPSSSFDAVICIYAIYHNTLENMRGTLAEIHRVLRRGGLAYVTFQTPRSHKYGLGREIEANTFVQDFDSDCQSESGVPHHFSSEEEVRRMMKAFHIMELKLEEFKTDDGAMHSHWQALAERRGATGMGP